MDKKQVEKLDMEAYQHKKCTWSITKDPSTIDPHIHTEVYF